MMKQKIIFIIICMILLNTKLYAAYNTNNVQAAIEIAQKDIDSMKSKMQQYQIKTAEIEQKRNTNNNRLYDLLKVTPNKVVERLNWASTRLNLLKKIQQATTDAQKKKAIDELNKHKITEQTILAREQPFFNEIEKLILEEKREPLDSLINNSKGANERIKALINDIRTNQNLSGLYTSALDISNHYTKLINRLALYKKDIVEKKIEPSQEIIEAAAREYENLLNAEQKIKSAIAVIKEQELELGPSRNIRSYWGPDQRIKRRHWAGASVAQATNWYAQQLGYNPNDLIQKVNSPGAGKREVHSRDYILKVGDEVYIWPSAGGEIKKFAENVINAAINAGKAIDPMAQVQNVVNNTVNEVGSFVEKAAKESARIAEIAAKKTAACAEVASLELAIAGLKVGDFAAQAGSAAAAGISKGINAFAGGVAKIFNINEVSATYKLSELVSLKSPAFKVDLTVFGKKVAPPTIQLDPASIANTLPNTVSTLITDNVPL